MTHYDKQTAAIDTGPQTHSHRLRGGFLNYATYATQGLVLRALRKIRKPSYATQDLALRALRKDITQRMQRNELLHGKGRPRPIMYKMETFKQSCCFVCSSVKKASPPKMKGIHFGQEILFHTRDERGVFSLFNVRPRPWIISWQFPVLPSLIVLLSEVGPATATIQYVHDCTSCHYQVKRCHVIGQTLCCLHEIRTRGSNLELRCVRCVACVIFTQGLALRCVRILRNVTIRSACMTDVLQWLHFWVFLVFANVGLRSTCTLQRWVSMDLSPQWTDQQLSY